MRARKVAWVSAALIFAGGIAVAATALVRTMQMPPPDGLSLAAILTAVERQHPGLVRSVEYERGWWRGWWEVSVCNEQCVELHIDPRTGEEMRRKLDDSDDPAPPAHTRGPAAIAKSFEERKTGTIMEMEFQLGVWQVEYREARGLLRGLKRTERRVFKVEPVSSSRRAPERPVRAPARNHVI